MKEIRMLGMKTQSYAAILIFGLLFTFYQSAFCAPIDERYAEKGPFATSSESVFGFQIHYPTNMVGNHPIITWGNGTATKGVYAGVF